MQLKRLINENEVKMIKKADDWLNEYGESHQNPINKMIHWICVPLIMLSLIGLLASIPNEFKINIGINTYLINWAMIFLVLANLYYFKLSKSLFIGMILISFLLLYGVELLKLYQIPLWQSSLLIFSIAWIGQFIGHKIEGIKPSFFKDIQFLLIGPAWLLSFIYKKLNIPI